MANIYIKSTLSVLLLLITFSCATYPDSPQAVSFVTNHNIYRANVNPPARCLPSIQWNWNLVATSDDWATKCIWQHSGRENVGENLYATSTRTLNSSSFNPAPAVNSWGNEKQWYNYVANTCLAGQVCGHYTQLVWDTSKVFGCAFQDCPLIQNLPWPNGGTIVVCQYLQPGNYDGFRPYSSYAIA